jgi:hypothetical protein
MAFRKFRCGRKKAGVPANLVLSEFYFFLLLNTSAFML